MIEEFDVCIIGAGPAGITAALNLADQGIKIALIESGTEKFSKNTQHLSDAEIVTPNTHMPMIEAVRRGLGGTSVLWGGRCVPLDPIDFEKRDFVNQSGWPINEYDIDPYYQKACEILGVGEANFNVASCNSLFSKANPLSSRMVSTESFLVSSLERWSRTPNIWSLQNNNILKRPNLTVLESMTCVGFRQSHIENPVTEVILQPTQLEEKSRRFIKSRFFIIACGGVECTRLILNSMRDTLGLKLRSSELVGRYYMGHPSGKIADIELYGNASETIFGFENDGETYVRRRITLKRETYLNEKLLNIAFWLDNPTISDWNHKNGVLSAAYLALSAPLIGSLLLPSAIQKRVIGDKVSDKLPHLLNCFRSPISTFLFCLRFIRERYFRTPRLPGFFTSSADNIYSLHFHAEQIPNWNSHIELSEEIDSHGLYRAKIALEWSDQDIDSIIRAHNVLDHSLQKNNIGRLIFRTSPDKFYEVIREQAVDGLHQIGSLRMSKNSSQGVTDSYGKVFGTTNLYIASSATFPTSGQANPTLAMIALTIRQCDQITKKIKNEH